MRLKHTENFLLRKHFTDGINNCIEFCRVMRIIIDINFPVDVPAIETPFHSPEIGYRITDLVEGHLHIMGNSNGCSGILHIVLSRKFQAEFFKQITIWSLYVEMINSVFYGKVYRIII